jgi:pimeloyl-ACP methyl ester carboxylesterase
VTTLQLRAADGVAIDARAWRANGPARATVVLVHGFSASKDDPNVEAVARALVDDGLAVVAVDCRGHGSSGGECTLGDLERHDVGAGVEFAAQSGGPVVLVGASMGAIASLRYAAGADDGVIAGVVAVSSPADWKLPRTVRAVLAAGITRTATGRKLAARFLGVRVHPVWTAAVPPRALAASLDVPLSIIHGAADRFVPVGAADALHAANTSGRALRQITIVPGMGHAFDAASVPAVVAAVDWVLSAASASAATTTPDRSRPDRYGTPSPR